MKIVNALERFAAIKIKCRLLGKYLEIPMPALVWTETAVLVLCVFIFFVDLKPKVDEAFFFSSDDPQMRSDKIISAMFPQPPQFIIGAKGDIHSQAYFDKVAGLSGELAKLPEVFSVQSISRGPDGLEDALKSPLWKRVLVSEDGKSTFLQVFVREQPGDKLVSKIERICRRFEGPRFAVMISGAPYIVELISRHLSRDLAVFSALGVVVFSGVLYLIFRSFYILMGTLLACFHSSAVTLILTHILHIPIGPLTANLSTMVFVLTLSPIVFLTYNWKNIKKEENRAGFDAVMDAVRFTFKASFWSMATTFAGFISLLFVQATPLRQLGISGALGTMVAFTSAYVIYPWFLEMSEAETGRRVSGRWGRDTLTHFLGNRHTKIAVGMMLFAVLLSTGLPLVNTDPDILSYFKKGSSLRNGLEYMDRNGGSSPLKMVVMDRYRAPFNTGDAYVNLWGLHQQLEKDPSVGAAISLPIVMAEAKRSPLAKVLSTEWLLKIMDSPRFGEVAKYFVTEDRKKTFFILGMKETGRKESRGEVIERIERIAGERGFAPVLTGGVYALQGKLSELLLSSLISGLLLLIIMFVVMMWRLSGSLQISGALLISLSLIPVVLLGLLGHARVPIDVVSAPAVNLAIGMGVDAMIYLSLYAQSAAGSAAWQEIAWPEACSRLWQPIGSSLLVLCSGFGIFLLSDFPPTQRFGFSVVLGSLVSACAALFLFPYLASLSLRREVMSHGQ